MFIPREGSLRLAVFGTLRIGCEPIAVTVAWNLILGIRRSARSLESFALGTPGAARHRIVSHHGRASDSSRLPGPELHDPSNQRVWNLLLDGEPQVAFLA